MAKRRLKNLEDARRYLSWLIRTVESGTIDPVKGGRLGYLCSILIRALEGSQLEARLDELEDAIGRKR